MINLLLIAVSLTSCSSVPRQDGDSGDPLLTRLLPGVSLGESVGIYKNAPFPEASIALAPEIFGTSQVVRGGSAILQVEILEGAQTVLVGLSGSSGYYEVSLNESSQTGGLSLINAPAESPKASLKYAPLLKRNASAQTISGGTVSLVVTVSNDETVDQIGLRIAVRTTSGVSQASNWDVRVNATAQASDQLQVSLNWTDPVDLDLHVETPDGLDIYYGSRMGQNGGELDLDSNAGCSIDGVNNENVTWPDSTPACGQYVVRVDLWSECFEPGPFPFVVTVNNKGNVTTYQGRFLASEADRGGAGSGRLITLTTVAAEECCPELILVCFRGGPGSVGSGNSSSGDDLLEICNAISSPYGQRVRVVDVGSSTSAETQIAEAQTAIDAIEETCSRKPRIVLVGHSWGGDSVRHSESIDASYRILIDPIDRNLSFDCVFYQRNVPAMAIPIRSANGVSSTNVNVVAANLTGELRAQCERNSCLDVEECLRGFLVTSESGRNVVSDANSHNRLVVEAAWPTIQAALVAMLGEG